jgi:hypothetical protein
MIRRSYLQNGLIGTVAALFGGAMFARAPEQPGPAMRVVSSVVAGGPVTSAGASSPGPTGLSAKVANAVGAFTWVAKSLSSPAALQDGFRSYFAFKSAHPDDVRKPLLYFVDYGQPSTAKRGYVFDMSALKIVDGPFTVAHGRGSSKTQYGTPTRFSNSSGSAATSLGLYVTKALYSFVGHTGGHAYSSVGLRLDGVSEGFNDRALARGVVAHGAPYVTATKAGRSEGCPAMEPSRAARLLPKLAGGAMVFLYAPNQAWLAGDPWLTGAN